MNMRMAVAHLKREPVRLEIMERVPGEVRMRVPRWGGEYFVYLDLTGKGGHYCTCRDFSPFKSLRRVSERLCRHVVAAILKENHPEMLLPLMLRETRDRKT